MHHESKTNEERHFKISPGKAEWVEKTWVGSSIAG